MDTKKVGIILGSITVILLSIIIFTARCKIPQIAALFSNGAYKCSVASDIPVPSPKPSSVATQSTTKKTSRKFTPTQDKYISVKFKKGINVIQVFRRNNLSLVNLGDKDSEGFYIYNIPADSKAEDILQIFSKDPDVEKATIETYKKPSQ